MDNQPRNTPVPPFIALLGECEINYIGRAKASSEGGEFLTIAKKDGTLILHSLQSGIRPVYYNPSRELSVSIDEDHISLLSVSKKGESLKIKGKVRRLMDIDYDNIGGSRTFEARIGTEKEMVRRIQQKPSLIGLKKKDFEGVEIRTSSGRFDLLFKDMVVEVKKRAGARSFDQLSRYMRGSAMGRGMIVCISATKTLKNAVKESKTIRLVEIPEWATFDVELPKENY